MESSPHPRPNRRLTVQRVVRCPRQVSMAGSGAGRLGASAVNRCPRVRASCFLIWQDEPADARTLPPSYLTSKDLDLRAVVCLDEAQPELRSLGLHRACRPMRGATSARLRCYVEVRSLLASPLTHPPTHPSATPPPHPSTHTHAAAFHASRRRARWRLSGASPAPGGPGGRASAPSLDRPGKIVCHPDAP